MKGGEPPNPFAGSGATQDRQTQRAASLVAETAAPFAAGRSVLFCVTAQKLLPAACGAPAEEFSLAGETLQNRLFCKDGGKVSRIMVQ